MKKFRFMVCSLLLVLCSTSICYAYTRSDEHINMRHIGNHNDHFNFPMPAETPDVYFNNDIQLHIFISFTY